MGFVNNQKCRDLEKKNITSNKRYLQLNLWIFIGIPIDFHILSVYLLGKTWYHSECNAYCNYCNPMCLLSYSFYWISNISEINYTSDWPSAIYWNIHIWLYLYMLFAICRLYWLVSIFCMWIVMIVEQTWLLSITTNGYILLRHSVLDWAILTPIQPSIE
jgi:hypothetical protein